MEESHDDIQIISEERISPQHPPEVINIDELVSDDDDDDVEIVGTRIASPLPPPPPPPPSSTSNTQQQQDMVRQNVLHAPGRTFPITQFRRLPPRSFPNTRSRVQVQTPIVPAQQTQSQYQRRRLEERRRAREIRQRFYREHGNDMRQRIWGMLPRDLSLGLGNFLFENIGGGYFRNEVEDDDGEEDDNTPYRATEERETEFWINRIEQLESQENDERVAKRLKYSEKHRRLLVAKAVSLQAAAVGYANSVITSSQGKKRPVCCQCGVELGEGIPVPHEGSTIPLRQLIDTKRVPAPYEYNEQYTESELINSKKVFFSKTCGHVYCGRCIQHFKKNVGKVKQRKKIKVPMGELEEAEVYEGTDNEDEQPILNLTRCCAYNCNANLHKFYEIYF